MRQSEATLRSARGTVTPPSAPCKTGPQGCSRGAGPPGTRRPGIALRVTLHALRYGHSPQLGTESARGSEQVGCSRLVRGAKKALRGASRKVSVSMGCRAEKKYLRITNAISPSLPLGSKGVEGQNSDAVRF